MHDFTQFPEPKSLKERLERTGHLWAVEEKAKKVTAEEAKLPLFFNSIASDTYIMIAKWAEADPILQSTTFRATYNLMRSLVEANLSQQRDPQYPRTRPPEVV